MLLVGLRPEASLDKRGDHVVKDHVYRHPSVKTALEELFLAKLSRFHVNGLFFSDSALFAGAARFVRSDPDAFGI
ncbi:MAG TPA: hypothetical protein VLT87_25785 [Thermoanaerobaculia bacterium]|nr:hypothetical protein [Thermoanaerobaculia bacterium]